MASSQLSPTLESAIGQKKSFHQRRAIALEISHKFWIKISTFG
ncbi:hypothetical protein [Planktothricoides sp. SR001]|nr:hypothetical protein [Planktothricoides sp. SR001]